MQENVFQNINIFVACIRWLTGSLSEAQLTTPNCAGEFALAYLNTLRSMAVMKAVESGRSHKKNPDCLRQSLNL